MSLSQSLPPPCSEGVTTAACVALPVFVESRVVKSLHDFLGRQRTQLGARLSITARRPAALCPVATLWFVEHTEATAPSKRPKGVTLREDDLVRSHAVDVGTKKDER